MPATRPAASARPAVHLICNAHLDPVWLWEWEEGAAEAISTFRSAVEFCETTPGMVFNHNESLLYEWVEEYEPALFERIRRQVKAGRWHVMGGWYLQPDCNLPSGEGFVRQALVGKAYFRDRFGVEPTTAINFDPFGHDRGLVQIIAKTGSDSYLFCRPWIDEYIEHPFPADTFRWVGYDGSEVLGCRAKEHYSSLIGVGHEKIQKHLNQYMADEAPHGMVLWGVGNHGGGPSRRDLDRINQLIADVADDFDVLHSTPEAYFDHVRTGGKGIPTYAHDIRPWGVGCYTTQALIKQKYRRLENTYFQTEKMLAHAALHGRLDYPNDELKPALKTLLFAQFHDILPGTSIQPVEEASLEKMGHGLDVLSMLRARAYFALARGQKPPKQEGRIPVLVYNPHPYPVDAIVACEFQLEDQNWTGTHTAFTVWRGRKQLPAQLETEASSLKLDWRKNLVFRVTLPPAQMSAFECRPQVLPSKPTFKPPKNKTTLRVGDATINLKTGLLDALSIDKQNVLRPNATRPLIIHDNSDSWGMLGRSFGKVVRRFRPMTATEAAQFAGISAHMPRLAPVRIIEDGPVRTVVEALLKAEDSAIQMRYDLPKDGGPIGVTVRVHWNEKDRFLKLELPLAAGFTKLHGQAAFGTSTLPTNGDETCAGRWVAVESLDQGSTLTVINDGTYGLDFKRGANPRLRLSLLRSPAYAGHPIHESEVITPQDRYSPRIDQGERLFRFWIQAGPTAERFRDIDREAMIRNEPPMALSFFSDGQGDAIQETAIRLDGVGVQLVACKAAEDGQGFVVRMHETTGRKRTARLRVPPLGLDEKLTLTPFEAKTIRLTPDGRATETDMLERPLSL
ncbi:MAG: glycoside hydrolase family 38 C-terminal domain-containing protein [Planctomycetota bacterium]